MKQDTATLTLNRGLQGRGLQSQSNNEVTDLRSGSTQRLPPTQRVSQVGANSNSTGLYTLTKPDPRSVR
jgi:hypothetical protein